MWAHPDVLDNGLAYLKANASRMLLISSYSNGDSYAAVMAHKLAEVSLVDSDWSIRSDDSGGRQLISPAGKTAAASAGAPGPVAPETMIELFWAFTDGSSRVLWVTGSSSSQAIVPGTSYSFPALTYTSAQPAPV